MSSTEPKGRLRGVVRCHECGWYIGRNLLRITEGKCHICENDMTTQDNYKNT